MTNCREVNQKALDRVLSRLEDQVNALCQVEDRLTRAVLSTSLRESYNMLCDLDLIDCVTCMDAVRRVLALEAKAYDNFSQQEVCYG